MRSNVQVTRVQRLWERMQEHGIADPDMSDVAYPEPMPLGSTTQLEPARSSRWVTQQEAPTLIMLVTILIVSSHVTAVSDRLPIESDLERG